MSAHRSGVHPEAGHHTESGGDRQHDQRMLAPIRWPRPDKASLLLIALWAAGLLVALVVPALLVPPDIPTTATIAGETVDGHVGSSASVATIWLAFGFTALGALIMMVAAYAWHRRTGSIGAAILAFVPSFVVVASGAIIATMFLLG